VNDLVLVETAERARTVTLNRPEARNALDIVDRGRRQQS